MWSLIKKHDWILTCSVLCLCAVGLLELWGLSLNTNGEADGFFLKQTLFAVFGLTAMLAFSLLDARLWRNYSLPLVALYFFTLAMLVGVLFFSVRIRGMTASFRFGELGFAPVEFAKLVLILILAKYFSGRHVEVYRARHIIVSAVYMIIPALLVLRQPDLGSAIILVLIWLGIVLLSGMKQRHLLIVSLLGVSLAFLAWGFLLKDYQKERIATFINPTKDPLGYSYNLIQSKIAIGSGGLLGKGLGQGTQGRLSFLPEEHTDFIFSVFAEEWGLVGVVFLFSIFTVFFWRLARIILNCQNNFFRLFVAGVAIMIFVQTLINAAMCLGLLPITGLSLPFLSYGGSNLLINFLALGIVQNIAAQAKVGQIKVEE
ncbi:MAG: rod shape-determining protein RodA [Patescibacteria group bacterium]